jgi:transposase
MLIKTVLNRVHKVKGFVYQKVRFVGDTIEVDVRPRRGSRPYCSGCGRRGPTYDHLMPRRFAFVPLWAISVSFIYAMRRVDCSRCGVTVEMVPWAQGKRHLTDAYAVFLARWARRLSWREVASIFKTSWENVCRSVAWVVEYGQDRTAKTLLRFFRMMGRERSAAIQFICSDMWRPYLRVIAKKASQAIHILDRFHIVARLNKALDEVRAAEARQLAREGYEPMLKHSRWCFLKNPENLTAKQRVKLRDLLRYDLRSVRAYLLKEGFQGLWAFTSAKWAGCYLDGWVGRAMRSRLEPIKKIARSIRAHRRLILNWFEAKKEFSAGIVEGLNYKVKLTIRKAYGFRELKVAEIALYHALARLPEPKLTHEFC